MAPTALDTVLLLLTATLACSRGAFPNADGAADARVVLVDPRADICPSPDAAPTAVTYAPVQKTFDESCVSCHDVPGGLDLSAGRSWGELINQPATDPDTCGGIRVAPGNLNGSYLYQKLSSASPCYGAQMPKGEFFSNPLPACVISMVAAWIAEGAPGPIGDGGGD